MPKRAASVLKLDWPLSGERIVAFLDIMGFKHMVADWPAERLYTLMVEVRDSVEKATQDTASTTQHTINGRRTEVRAQLTRVAFFSDSILIVSAGTGVGSTFALIMGVLKAFYALLQAGVPCRGGIARGQFVADFDKSVFFGQPLIDAYLLAESLPWYGVAMPVGSFYPPSDEPIPPKTDEWIPMTHCFAVPTKQGVRELEMINWPAFLNDERDVTERLKPFRRPDDPKLHAYYSTTLELAITAFRATYPKRKKQTGRRNRVTNGG